MGVRLPPLCLCGCGDSEAGGRSAQRCENELAVEHGLTPVLLLMLNAKPVSGSPKQLRNRRAKYVDLPETRATR